MMQLLKLMLVMAVMATGAIAIAAPPLPEGEEPWLSQQEEGRGRVLPETSGGTPGWRTMVKACKGHPYCLKKVRRRRRKYLRSQHGGK
jgi:hypothetical protein